MDHTRMSRPGWLEVVTGSMFSGKSEELIRRLRRAQIARQKVQIFKPAIDNRFSDAHITSHSEMRIPSDNIRSSRELLAMVEADTEVVGIDEGQFFDADLPAVCNALADQGKTLAALEELATALGLPAPPLRIECYDISTIQGTNTVGSMVVFEEGRPRSGEYRRFRVKSVVGTDDYASHREVLWRRFYRALEAEEGVAEELRWRLPDLVVIDGGLGQVNAARGVMDALGLHDLPVVGLAKEREEIFLPGLSQPLVLPANSQALYLVQRLRDEAHRFAITYHRKLRAKSQTRSVLDDVAGVGPARKRALLRVFGSTRQMRSATIEEIAAVPGISRALAETIHAALNA